jgi:hypothetical protein
MAEQISLFGIADRVYHHKRPDGCRALPMARPGLEPGTPRFFWSCPPRFRAVLRPLRKPCKSGASCSIAVRRLRRFSSALVRTLFALRGDTSREYVAITSDAPQRSFEDGACGSQRCGVQGVGVAEGRRVRVWTTFARRAAQGKARPRVNELSDLRTRPLRDAEPRAMWAPDANTEARVSHVGVLPRPRRRARPPRLAGAPRAAD